MRMHDAIELIEKSKDFKEWKKQRKNAFMSHAFVMFDDDKEGEWQIGYYDPDKDRITAILATVDDIKIGTEEQVYKEPDKTVNKVHIEKVEILVHKALEIVDSLVKEKYKNEPVNKKICILQDIENFGLVWNISLVTAAFNVINIKIDVGSGEIKADEKHSLMEFGKRA